MERICRQGEGLFPAPKEINFTLLVPGLGDDVQARCRGALRGGCAP